MSLTAQLQVALPARRASIDWSRPVFALLAIVLAVLVILPLAWLAYVFHGWVDISVEGHGTTRMVAGDAMCVAVDMRHNVSKFSADYDLIEMCLPADYSTVAMPAPDGQ